MKHDRARPRPALWPALLLLPLTVAAQQAPDLPGDLDALLLADQTPEVSPAAARDWKGFAELAAGSSRRTDGRLERSHRLSLDFQTEQNLTPDLRFNFANRLDLVWPAGKVNGSEERAVHTLKEAYVGGRLDEATLLDAGRINVRNGVASGYNPTDFFRARAVRSPVSINPTSLRENRQGSVMLRGQRLWDSGSVTALFAPNLHRQASSSGLNPDLGATNQSNRLLLTLSQKLAPGFTPQFLLYQDGSEPLQAGLNLTGLLNDSTVAYVEWSGGRRRSLLDEALATPSPERRWRNQLATGLTYTTPTKLSLTAEYQYHGTALSDADWLALPRTAPLAYGPYRNWLSAMQETPGRQGLFFHALWQDAFLPRLDVSLMHNRDRADHSHRSWLEARYHEGNVEYALQWQGHQGSPWSQFGAVPQARSWQFLLRSYL